VLWEAHKENFGPQGDPLILVAQGASRDFNPTLNQRGLSIRPLRRDPAFAAAEYLTEFRCECLEPKWR
jgi:hypothetical protein